MSYREDILMRCYIGFGVVFIFLVICIYYTHSIYEEKDIVIETRLIKAQKENERERQTLNYDYLEILMRSEEELIEYKDLYDFLKDLSYVNWEKECIIVTSYPIERCTYKRKNKHNKYYLLDILYKNRNRNVYVYVITGKNYIQYDTAGMYKEQEFK